MSARFVVVGIGAGGWSALPPAAQESLRGAAAVFGSRRQLDLLPAEVVAPRTAWESPMSAHLSAMVDAPPADVVHVLASGDPMFHGIGSTLVRLVGADRVDVMSAPSSVSLAAARLGWDLATTRVISLVGAPADTVVSQLGDGLRLLILSRDGSTPAQVAECLRDNGFGASMMSVLANLGASDEQIVSGAAADWHEPSPALNVVAVDCVGPAVSRAPGLSDEAYLNDGQLTKAPIRALTVSALAPSEGQLLWDVGAGSGSVGIEWLRQLRTGRVLAFEADPERAARVVENARRHGVGDRLDVRGAAPDALADAPAPDTVFIGGGLTADILSLAWDALGAGGRLVANAVTLETERLLTDAADRHGGELLRISVERARPLGRSTAWRPALPVVQWCAVKTEHSEETS